MKNKSTFAGVVLALLMMAAACGSARAGVYDIGDPSNPYTYNIDGSNNGNYSYSKDDNRVYVNGRLISGHLTERIGKGDRIETYIDGRLASTEMLNANPPQKNSWWRQTPAPKAEYFKLGEEFHLFHKVKSVNIFSENSNGTGKDLKEFTRRYHDSLTRELGNWHIKIDKNAPISIALRTVTIPLEVDSKKITLYQFSLEAYSWVNPSQNPTQNFFVSMWSSRVYTTSSLSADQTDELINT